MKMRGGAALAAFFLAPAAGQDLDGSRWRCDPKARLYTNLNTGRTCAKTTLRHVCGA